MNPPYALLALRLMQARTQADLNQSALSRLIGVKQQTVSRWEAGTHRPAIGQIAQLATALALEPQELMRLAHYAPETSAAPLVQPLPLDNLSPENFERFVADLLQEQHPNAFVRLQGARGHDQGGFDVLVDFPDGKRWGVQCKRELRFGPANVKKVVAAATLETDVSILALSRVATPQAAAAIQSHPRWRLWDQEDISREVRRLPGAAQDRLVDIFFAGQRLALLGRAEPGPWTDAQTFFAPFANRAGVFSHDWPLAGREEDLTRLVDAMTALAAPFSMLVAPGGMGKSRLLKAATERFALRRPAVRLHFLATSLDPTRGSLEALGPGPKILIVDDAHDRDSLGVIFSYVADPENNARVLVSTRPYALQRIRNDAAVAGLIPAHVVALAPLTSEAMKHLVEQVLDAFGGPAHWAQNIVGAVSDNPLVAVMAARTVAREGLPMELARNTIELRTFILSRFMHVVTGAIAPPADQPLVRNLLELLALIQPFHIEDRRLIELAEKTKGMHVDDVIRLLRLLDENGVIYKRGSAYRLMPDLLGDHLIEQSCVGPDGRLTPFAERVAMDVDPQRLTQVMVNLGRLDWRRADGDPSKSRLLDSIWWTLRDIEDEWDQRLNAVRAVAIYQPAQALQFVQMQIDSGRTHHALSGILRAIALVPDYRRKACMLLWQLGRDDEKELGSHPAHPIRVLSELADYTGAKPLAFIEGIVDFALELTHDPAAWGSRYTPLDLLAHVLKGEGMNAHPAPRAIELRSFLVDYNNVRPLRAKVISRVLELLHSPQPDIAHRAAVFARNALRPPMGLLGAAPDEALSALYAAEFVETLTVLRGIVETGNLAPGTLMALARGVSWHAEHGVGDERDAAIALLRALPTDLDFRMRAALADSWGSEFGGQTSFDDWRADAHEEWIPQLAAELKAAFDDPEALCRRLMAASEELASTGEALESSYVLIGALLEGDLPLSLAFISRAAIDATARPFLGVAIRQFLAQDPARGRRFVADALAHAEPAIAVGGAHAFVGLKRRLATDDITLLQRALQSDVPWIVRTALQALRVSDDFDEQRALDLALLAPFERHPELFPEVAMMLREGRRGLGTALDEGRTALLLQRMDVLPSIEGHWPEELLRTLAKTQPVMLVDFLLRRMERVGHLDGSVRASRHREHLALHKSEQAVVLLQRVWRWCEQHAASTDTLRYYTPQLFTALFRPDDDVVISFFEQKLDTADAAQLDLIAALLREAHHSFIFRRRAFVERFLECCRRVGGRETLDAALQALSASAASGGRSGRIGEPMPRDVRTKAQAEEVLARLSRLSPAYALYDGVLRDAESDIARSIEDGRRLDVVDEE